MSFWYIGPSTGGGGTGGTTPTSANVELHDDLTAQIDDVKDIFTVTRGSYEAGSLNISVGGVGGMQEGIHFTEIDPATGRFQTAEVLEAADAPLVVQYKY